MAKDTMKAVVFKGSRKVVVEDRPIPQIKENTDIIVKVKYTALCGSEMHVFRVGLGRSNLVWSNRIFKTSRDISQVRRML